jgi:hypothetical protein
LPPAPTTQDRLETETVNHNVPVLQQVPVQRHSCFLVVRSSTSHLDLPAWFR